MLLAGLIVLVNGLVAVVRRTQFVPKPMALEPSIEPEVTPLPT